MQFLFGCLLGILVALGAYRLGALSRSGGLAAAITGGLIFGLGGLGWAALLLTFFISSSALSKLFDRRKADLSEKFSKGSRRDWGQVTANGGLGAGLVILSAQFPGAVWPWIAYIGAMAAVNADTWATELGVLSRKQPRLVTTGQRVERGTSGAVSLAGTLATLAGAALVGLVAVAFMPVSGELSPVLSALALIATAAAAGFSGSVFDSLLGATVQAIYYCPVCQKETERHPLHSCGAETSLLRGWFWMNNDVVNFLCSLVGALAALGVWFSVFA